MTTTNTDLVFSPNGETVDDSIKRMATEVARRNEAKRDFVVNTGHEDFYFEPQVHTGGRSDSGFYLNGEPFTLTRHAETQVADKLKIPVKYFDRMKEERPDLLATNINTWLKHNPKNMLFRTLDNRGRAFVSDRFRPLDNFDMMKAVLPAIVDSGLKVKESAITDQRMIVKAVSERLTGDVKVGETVQYGVVFGNSEVGAGSYFVSEFIYTLRCRNGMVGQRILSKNHLGSILKNNEGLQEWFSDETRLADNKALLLKTRDVVKGMLSEENFQKYLSRCQEAAVSEKLTGDIPKIIEVTARDNNLTQSEGGLILQHLIEGGDLTQWGVASAITRAAQDVGSYDRKMDLEATGNRIIELPKNDWEVIAKSA